MNKRFGLYTCIWTLLLALFNAFSFASLAFTSVQSMVFFWIAYGVLTALFIGHLILTYFALKADSAKKLFLNISLITRSYTGVVATFVFGSVCMIVPVIPYWAGIVLGAIIFIINLLFVVKATAAISEIECVDEKVKVGTLFIKSLTIDADTLVASAKSEAIKAECKKVYEAIRYSDPMSNDALAQVEEEIAAKFATLADAVKADNVDEALASANEVLVLIGDRNKKCKLLK